MGDWPADPDALRRARALLGTAPTGPCVIAADRDVDGLAAAVLGTVADLGVHAPFPLVRDWLAQHGSRELTEAIALLNAARRAAGDEVGRVTFAMRTTAHVNLVELLRSLPLGPVEGEYGFGHPAATGGSLSPRDFGRLLSALGFQDERRAAAS